MIALLTGVVTEKRPPSLILDVNGVGYEVFVPQTIYSTLPDIGEIHTLRIKFIKKEDSITLYGFNTLDEKAFFELLISVSGIGDKTALKFLNVEPAEEILNWIVSEDLKNLSKLPGLGNKTAKKVILELSGKIVSDKDTVDTFNADALGALISLGYDEKSAKAAIKKVITNGKAMKTEDIIQKVLSL